MDNKAIITSMIVLLLLTILILSCEKDKSLQCETEQVPYTLNQNGEISHGFDTVTTCTDFEGNTFEL